MSKNQWVVSSFWIKRAIDAVQQSSRDLRGLTGNKGGNTHRVELIEQNRRIEGELRMLLEVSE